MKKALVIGIVISVAILAGIGFSQSETQEKDFEEISPIESTGEPKQFREILSESANISTP